MLKPIGPVLAKVVKDASPEVRAVKTPEEIAAELGPVGRAMLAEIATKGDDEFLSFGIIQGAGLINKGLCTMPNLKSGDDVTRISELGRAVLGAAQTMPIADLTALAMWEIYT